MSRRAGAGRGGTGRQPVTVALVNDYQVVVERLRELLAPFSNRVAVVDLEVGTTDVAAADVAVFDTLGGQRHALSRARALVERRNVGHVVVFTREPTPSFVHAAAEVGVDVVIDKSATVDELVEAIEALAADRPVAPLLGGVGPAAATTTDDDGLTLADRELLALLAKGLSNEQIADELFTDVGAVRSGLRALYARLRVANRIQAAVHATRFGFSTGRGRRAGSTDRRRSRWFPRAPRAVRSARSFVAQVMARLGASEEEIDAFRLAVSELGANVVMHGTGRGWTVGVRVGQSGCTMDVWGGTAPPDNVVHHPERWAVADPDRPTGRGLGIVRELMDDVTTEVWRDQVRVVCRLATASSTRRPPSVAATR